MLEVEEQLRRYGDALERHLVAEADVAIADEAFPDGGRRVRRWAAVAAALVLIVVGAVVVARTRTHRAHVVTQPALHGRVFSTDTGVVLLFSDGIDGVTAVDLDNRIAGRRVVDGARAGDQPFRLTLTNQNLIVGWGEIYAAPLAGGASRKIDDATIYLPASEPGDVWTVTWEGGRIGVGASTVREVTVTGDVVFSSTGPDTDVWHPVFGIPGGLVVQSSTGIAIWDDTTATVGPILGPGLATSIVSDGRSLVWCDDPCTAAHTAPLEHTGRPTPPHVAANQRLAISTDGQRLALLRPSATGGYELVVEDTTTKTEQVIATGLSQFGGIQWTSDGSQLFYSEGSYQQNSTRLGRYTVSTRTWEEQTIPVGGLLGAIPLSRDDARSFFSTNLVAADQCNAGTIYPSGRTGTCTFPF